MNEQFLIRRCKASVIEKIAPFYLEIKLEKFDDAIRISFEFIELNRQPSLSHKILSELKLLI
jgi:hypothetical protein